MTVIVAFFIFLSRREVRPPERMERFVSDREGRRSDKAAGIADWTLFLLSPGPFEEGEKMRSKLCLLAVVSLGGPSVNSGRNRLIVGVLVASVSGSESLKR